MRIDKKELCQLGIVMVLVVAFSFVMINNDYNNMLEDLESGQYTKVEGNYSDFKGYETGLTIAENGAVYRNIYLGYINNIIVDNSFMGISKDSMLDESKIENLQSAKWETVTKMLLMHFHYIMAIGVYLLYRLIDYVVIVIIGLNGIFVKHRGDISDSNFDNVMRDLRKIKCVYNNNMQVVFTIIFSVLSTFGIRLALNYDDYSLMYVLIIAYMLITVLNYILKYNISDSPIKVEKKNGNKVKEDVKDTKKEDLDVKDNNKKEDKE